MTTEQDKDRQDRDAAEKKARDMARKRDEYLDIIEAQTRDGETDPAIGLHIRQADKAAKGLLTSTSSAAILAATGNPEQRGPSIRDLVRSLTTRVRSGRTELGQRIQAGVSRLSTAIPLPKAGGKRGSLRQAAKVNPNAASTASLPQFGVEN